MNALGLFCAAIVIEGIVTYVKTFFVDGKLQWQMLVGIALGILVAVTYSIDVFNIVGMTTTIPYVGCVLTGILLSRGANYIFDLVDLLAKVLDKEPKTKQ